eukprot:TRINITY_DN26078_c0_g1_i2.p2 TRINITY_DN26078_c0_g1~~TRINITY_DN26078_c0_g1_i2.p2  ORF type:complete len:209 (+),score=73.12 TRINITY_DN26078_c0_g1_i2:166-792(+)
MCIRDSCSDVVSVEEGEPKMSRKARMAAMKESKAVQERLWNACKVGSLDGAQRALAAGADVNAVDAREAGEHEHVPAIVSACAGGYPDVVQLCADAGADIEGANAFGVTGLMEAASSETSTESEKGKARALATVEKLIELGANVNAVDCDGETALYKAALEGCERSVKLLLNRGADPKMTDNKGRDAADMAEGKGHAKLAMLLRLVSK